MLHPGMNKIKILKHKASIIHIFRLQLFPIIYAAFWFAVVVYYNIKKKKRKILNLFEILAIFRDNRVGREL